MLTFKLVLLSLLVARGSFEVRESRWALSLVVLVWGAYAAAIALQLPVLQPVLANMNESTMQVTCGNLILIGTLALFTAHIVFARFVYLQALGIIKPVAIRSKKSKVSGKKSSKTGKARKTLTDKSTLPLETEGDTRVSSTSPQPALPVRKENGRVEPSVSKVAPTMKASQVSSRENDRDDERVIKLSKAEQRRQRKQQQSSQRRAA
jgi:hypothetical protein